MFQSRHVRSFALSNSDSHDAQCPSHLVRTLARVIERLETADASFELHAVLINQEQVEPDGEPRPVARVYYSTGRTPGRSARSTMLTQTSSAGEPSVNDPIARALDSARSQVRLLGPLALCDVVVHDAWRDGEPVVHTTIFATAEDVEDEPWRPPDLRLVPPSSPADAPAAGGRAPRVNG